MRSNQNRRGRTTGHQHTEIRNAKEAECETTGYTGDTYCTDCNKKLKEGVVIELTGHQNIEVRDASRSNL